MSLLSVLFGGNKSATSNAEVNRAVDLQNQMQGIGQGEAGRFTSATPMEQYLLQQYMQELAGGATQGPGMVQNAQGQTFGAFGSRGNTPGLTSYTPPTPETALLNSPEYQQYRQANEQNVNRQAALGSRSLMSNLAGRGLANSSMTAGGLAGIQGAAGQGISNYNQQLIQQAHQDVMNRLGAASQATQPALAAGQTAGSLFGGAGQLSTSTAGTAQGLKQAQTPNILGTLTGAGGAAAGAYGSLANAGALAGGGPVKAGGGPAVGGFDPKKFFSQLADMMHHAYLMGNGAMQSAGRDLTTPIPGNPTPQPQQGLGNSIGEWLLAHSAPQGRAGGGEVSSPAGLMGTGNSIFSGYGRPIRRALGGPANPGQQPYLTGEQGKELYLSDKGDTQVLGQNGPQMFTPPENGYIIPHEHLADMASHPNTALLLNLLGGK